MKRISEFIKAIKYSIFWTIGYFVVVWAILQYIFHFDALNEQHWIRIASAHIHTFSGLVFGLVLLSAVPIYLAVLIIILRTKKPVITAPKTIQNTINKLFTRPAQPKAPEPTPETTHEEVPQQFPADMPTELYGAYNRTKTHNTMWQQSVFNATPPQTPNPLSRNTPNAPHSDTCGLPLPSDFDSTDDFITPAPPKATTNVPVFHDLNFDDDNTNPTPSQTTPETADLLIKHLTTQGHSVQTDDKGIIICDNLAIAIHDDKDFWVADSDTWFAAGKSKPSPTHLLITEYASRGMRPVLYLAEQNIMDLNACCAEWQNTGIIIATSLAEIPD